MVNDNVMPTTDENEDMDPAEVLNNDLDFAIMDNLMHDEIMTCGELSQYIRKWLFNSTKC